MTNVRRLSQHNSIDAARSGFDRLQFLESRNSLPSRVFDALPQPSQARLEASLTEQPFVVTQLALASSAAMEDKEKSVFYLAYGSNLCNETFRGVRGIRPLSQVNVVVPALRLTFDLPGIPYAEPCFANTARRVPDAKDTKDDSADAVGKSDYHKDRWHKGLVGVVYEVTMGDYAHIIATEGGGSAYEDILVDCYILPELDTVPSAPKSQPFRAHTLLAPTADHQVGQGPTDRPTRSDSSYAQPSARYLKLITDGATECRLPAEYQDYLHDIRPYTITRRRQAVGKALFLAIWMPFVTLIFAMSRRLQDKRGRAPWWFAQFSAIVFSAMWLSYDRVFKGAFGDGERTISDEVLEERNNGRRYILAHTGFTEKRDLFKEAVDGMLTSTTLNSSPSSQWTDAV